MQEVSISAKDGAKSANEKLSVLLEKLPHNKVQELLDFADYLVFRYHSQPKVQGLGDRFAGVWQDDRSADEIIADIRSSRVDVSGREEL